jgi:hypothetical protein
MTKERFMARIVGHLATISTDQPSQEITTLSDNLLHGSKVQLEGDRWQLEITAFPANPVAKPR